VKLALLAALLTTACASGGGSGALQLTPPEITLHHLEVPPASPTSFQAVVRLDVANRAGEAITIDRIVLASVGVGAYNIATSERDFHRAIEPDQFSTFEVFATAVTVAGTDEVLAQREGPIMIRGTVQYSHSGGSARKVFVQRVGTSYGRSPE
jgi:hypothetical protein